MPLFHYRAQDENTGEMKEGDQSGHDKFAVTKDLRAQGLQVIAIDEKKKNTIDTSSITAFLSRIKLEEKILFTRNLSAMIEAGLPLARGLSVLERQTRNPKLKKVLQSVQSEVTSGKTLSDSLEKHPKVFSALFVSMVRVGEETGKLAESLVSIGDQLDKSFTLRRKIKGAMMYPAIVITVMIVIGILMFIFVVPTLTETFRDMEIDLPASTQLIILLSDFISAHPILIFVLFIGAIVGLISFGKTSIGSRVFNYIALHVPIISPIVVEYNTAQTTRTLSSLLSAGVSVVDALDITQDVLQNSYYKKVLVDSGVNVQKGVPISKAFIENENLFPPIAGEMIMVGEETGQLAAMMTKIAVFYESEVEAKTKDLTTVIEPILMVFIGGAVGFFAMAMISPMYSLGQGF